MKKIGYVYACYDEKGDPLYIGQTDNVVNRYKQHNDNKEKWVDEVRKIIVHGPYDSTNATNYFEEAYIRNERPKYNKSFNKGYEAMPFEDPYGSREFYSEKDMIAYFETKKEFLKPQTYYLRLDQIEAIYVYSFENRIDRSRVVRQFVDEAIVRHGIDTEKRIKASQ